MFTGFGWDINILQTEKNNFFYIFHKKLVSISFDREHSVVSKEVQKLMETKNIKLTLFKMFK